MSADSPRQPGPRIPELDGIRGLAISMVVFGHYISGSINRGSSWMADALAKTLTLGWSGVDLFFVLSGFLIGGILLDHRQAPNYFKAFYIRRCCRILPPYLLLLPGFLIFRALLWDHASEHWASRLFFSNQLPFWTFLTFTQNLATAVTGAWVCAWLVPTWSLAIEEQFYWFLPLALWLARPSLLVKLLGVFVVLYPVVQLFLYMFHPVAASFFERAFPIRADALFVGVICAYALRQNQCRCWLEQNIEWLRIAFIVLLLGMGYIASKEEVGGYVLDKILCYYLWISLFYACLLVLVVVEKNGLVSTAMRFKSLRKLGIISYGVYLFHEPINGLMHGWLLGRDQILRHLSDFYVTAAALVVTLLFATALWRFMERPIIQWGHRFPYGQSKTDPLN